MIYTTSYKDKGFKDIITGVIKLYDPKLIVELGTQQGASAIVIGKAMAEDAILYTYDSFESKYDKPPYSQTHANLEQTLRNIYTAELTNRIFTFKKNAMDAYRDFDEVDMLHVDLCNYRDNVEKVLTKWHDKVRKVIILEGGGFNKWQKEKGFAPFNEILDMDIIKDKYDKVILKKNENYAITLLIRK